MKQIVKIVENCAGCHFSKIDSIEYELTCLRLDVRVNPKTIDPNCPLDEFEEELKEGK